MVILHRVLPLTYNSLDMDHVIRFRFLSLCTDIKSMLQLILLATSGVCGICMILMLNKGYGFYMAAVFIIGGGHGFRIEVYH